MTAGAGGDGGMGGEVIEVQILPQDDNWGDNTTAITGNTSVRSESFQVSKTCTGAAFKWRCQRTSSWPSVLLYSAGM